MDKDEQLKVLRDKLKNIQGTPCEVYTRIVGYYRSMNSWNPGKKSEYIDRKSFRVKLDKV